MNRLYSALLAVQQAIGTETAARGGVYVGRARPLSDHAGPDARTPRRWIIIGLGEAGLTDESDGGVIQRYGWLVEVLIDLHVRSRDEDWLPALMVMQAEVHARLMADYTLGEDWIVQIDPVFVDEPDVDASGDQVSAVLRTRWRMHVVTSIERLDA